MRRMLAAGLILALAAGPAFAQDMPDLGALAGVYRERVRINMPDGRRLDGQNILEIEPLDPATAPGAGAAYVRLALVFDNGHTCSFWGVAEADGPDTLRYSRPASAPGGRCELRLRVSPERITLQDQGESCRLQHCGARGYFTDIGFARSRRRDIGYRGRLRASREFAKALAEWRGGRTPR